MFFHYVSIISLWKKHGSSFEQTPSPKDDLFQVVPSSSGEQHVKSCQRTFIIISLGKGPDHPRPMLAISSLLFIKWSWGKYLSKEYFINETTSPWIHRHNVWWMAFIKMVRLLQYLNKDKKQITIFQSCLLINFFYIQ